MLKYIIFNLDMVTLKCVNIEQFKYHVPRPIKIFKDPPPLASDSSTPQALGFVIHNNNVCVTLPNVNIIMTRN